MTDEKPILRLKRQRRPDRDGGGAVCRERAAAGRGAAGRGARLIRRNGKLEPVARAAPVRKATEADLLAELQSMAPQVWDPARPAPLAVGIHRQLNPVAEAKGMSRRFVRRFLGRWTSSPAYLCALCRPDAQRFNADGSGAEAVLERHRERAERRLEKRQAAANDAAGGSGEEVSASARA